MDLVTEVMEGLRQRMMEMDWLDSITRERAIEKVDYNTCTHMCIIMTKCSLTVGCY